MKVRITGTVLLAVAASATGAEAQQPDTFRLKEIVVTATKLPLPRSATTAVVTVLSGDSLRRQGVHTVADAMRLTASAALAQNGGPGAITSLFLRGGESDYVQVLIDGVRVNNPGGVFDFANLTLDNIERIEIVRGPVSVLYGSDAVTGVVQVFTRRAAPSSLRLHVNGGTGQRSVPDSLPDARYGATNLGVDAGTQWGALGVTAGVGHANTGGIYAFNNQYRNTTGSVRAELRSAAGSEVSWTGRYTRSKYHYPTDGNGRLVDRNQRRETEAFTTGLNAATRLDGKFEVSARGGLNHSDERYHDEPDAPGDRAGVFTSHSRGRLRRSFIDLTTHYRPVEGSVITAGGELERQEDRNRYESDSEFGPFSARFGKERTNRAVYGQVVHSIGALVVNGGARFDDNDRFGTFTTYRAGAALQVLPMTRLRVAAGTAFKEPTFFENYAEGFTKGNPTLEPEHSRTLEAGIEQTLPDATGSVQLTLFRQRFRDLIQYVPTEFGSTEPNYLNVAAARADGAELEWTLMPVQRLGVAGSLTLLKTEVLMAGTDDPAFTEGKELLRRPELQGSLMMSYRFGRVGTDVRWTHVGRRDDLDFSTFPFGRVTLPSFDRLDIGAAVNGTLVGQPALQFTARIENLLDERYEEILNFPARGRSLWLGVEARIGQ
jgi:vitamin B12 transporter